MLRFCAALLVVSSAGALSAHERVVTTLSWLLCAVLSATATAFAAIIWGLVVNVLAEDRLCILYASNKGELVEPLNKNSQICAFSFIGECVVGSFTAALTVWFAIKARCGVGWKAEVWSSLVQLIVLIPLFLMATICATVITAGVQHTCESSIFNNFTSNTSDCAQLYFHGSPYEYYDYYYSSIRQTVGVYISKLDVGRDDTCMDGNCTSANSAVWKHTVNYDSSIEGRQKKVS